VQAILLVENSVRFYSLYLPLIYTELMRQTQTLIGEGVNLTHKLLRMRARPKILLATNYEEAQDLYQRYKHNLLGVITDVEFNREGKADPEAGLLYQPRFSMLWLNLHGLANLELLKVVGARFRLHPLTQEDILNTFEGMTKHLFKAKSLRSHRNILTHRRIFIDHDLPKIKHPHYILLSMVL
jgi:Mg2+ and Co2+ transporter CorA